MRWRIAAALLLVTSLLGFAGYVFWLQDWKYNLPTPKPQGLQQIAIGSKPPLPPALARLRREAGGRPLFLHFFNPDCPCSRFNEEHVQTLVRANKSTTRFVAVVEPEGGELARDAAANATRDFGMDAVLDGTGEIGRALGVYSTPQAVILNADGTLFFRGNYNLSRYCVDAKTEYARLALEHALAGRPYTAPEGASIAYGCELPANVHAAAGGAQ